MNQVLIDNLTELSEGSMNATYNILTALRGPDILDAWQGPRSPSDAAAAEVKHIVTTRLRYIVFGEQGASITPGSYTTELLTLDDVNKLREYCKIMGGTNMWHFTTHLYTAMKNPAIQSHSIWDGHGAEVTHLLAGVRSEK